jgi:DNA-binding response OmpR family regulator
MHLKRLDLPKAAVLVLEEDPFLRAGLCSLLTKAGYAIAEGLGGAQLAGRIDLVLAGVGARPASKPAPLLRDRTAPLILLVDHGAWSGLDFLDAANAFGAAAVLSRPFSRSALLSLIAELLAQPARDDAEDEKTELPSLAELLVGLESAGARRAE